MTYREMLLSLNLDCAVVIKREESRPVTEDEMPAETVKLVNEIIEKATYLSFPHFKEFADCYNEGFMTTTEFVYQIGQLTAAALSFYEII